MDAFLDQFIAPLFAWFAALLTKAEWGGLVWLVSGTLVLTHVAKIAWRRLPIPGGGDAKLIQVLAVAIGSLLGFWLWPVESHAPRLLAGAIGGGGGAIASWRLFWPLLSTVFPTFAAKLNADRRKDPNPIPPAGTTERRADQ